MLVTLKKILQVAEAQNCAIGAFNVPSLEGALAVVYAAEELGKAVILMHAQLHEPVIPLKVIGPIMLRLADEARVPVCVHLDHGTSLDYLNDALKLGFTSIMYDGSTQNYEINKAYTSIAVEMAAKTGASVEGEIGIIGVPQGNENYSTNTETVKDFVASTGVENYYTSPETAKDFVASTGIDALACAFGTVHGLYKSKPKLDFQRVEEIHSLVDVPLVMHGASGLSESDYEMAIKSGIRKINYFTYMSLAGGEFIKSKINTVSDAFYHEIRQWGQDAMKKDALNVIRLFSHTNN